jgi:hypothetical protein
MSSEKGSSRVLSADSPDQHCGPTVTSHHANFGSTFRRRHDVLMAFDLTVGSVCPRGVPLRVRHAYRAGSRSVSSALRRIDAWVSQNSYTIDSMSRRCSRSQREGTALISGGYGASARCVAIETRRRPRTELMNPAGTVLAPAATANAMMLVDSRQEYG